MQGRYETKCVGGKVYQSTLIQNFHDVNSWRQYYGGLWATEYAWGRTNPGADDAAYYIDKTEGLGTPVYDPFRVRGNSLDIEAQPVGNVPGLSSSQIGGYDYVSGMLTTAGPNHTTFIQRYGYYEASVRLPKGQGFWPAFWMLDAWGGGEELNVFEVLDNATSTINQGAHYQGGGTQGGPYQAPFDGSMAFHRYGVQVTPTTDNFYVDGVETLSVPDVTVGDMYFIFSFQIGGNGSWPGPPDGTTPWPGVMRIHYSTPTPPRRGFAGANRGHRRLPWGLPAPRP